MANAAQLKALLSSSSGQDFYYTNLVLLILSLALQVIVGVLLVMLASMEGRKHLGQKSVTLLNDVSIGLVFAITVLNVFIASFGIKLSE